MENQFKQLVEHAFQRDYPESTGVSASNVERQRQYVTATVQHTAENGLQVINVVYSIDEDRIE